jgi:Protein of unknown function (DUF3017)
VAHLRAVPDPDDVPEDVAETDRVVEPIDPAAATAPGEDDPPHDDVHDEELEERPRRYPSTIGGAFYLSILAVAGTALFITYGHDWRLGIQILGGSLLAAALIRLVLANRDAGMLAVRNRFVDVTLLTGAAVALIVLATTIPDMPV